MSVIQENSWFSTTTDLLLFPKPPTNKRSNYFCYHNHFMSSLPSPPSPPSPPPHHLQLQQTHSHLNKKPITAIPDFIFSAFSLFFLFSSPKSTTSFSLIPNIAFPLNPRRFLGIPIMSLPFLPPSKTPNAFPNPQSLSDWLKPRLPSDSFASWGVKPGTKNVHNLWLELSEGETLLADSTPPVRTVEVVVVRVIGKGNKLLLESHQQLSNGDVRNRCRPLSEKMKPGESVEAAACRAIKEELGSIIGGGFNGSSSGIVTIVSNSYSKKVEEGVSASYPGLPAHYVLHTVDALVQGLPEGDFYTEEAEEYEDSDGKKAAHDAVSCRKHYWKWVDSYDGVKV